MHSFLTSILGEIGAKAIDRVSEEAPLLKPVIIPRVVISWIECYGKLGYEGNIPGVDQSYLSLKKNQDDSYTGAITIGDYLYSFEKSDLLQVAATLGVALKIEVGELDERLKKKDLTNLGKSIDLLVKSEVIKTIRKQQVPAPLTKSESEMEPIVYEQPVINKYPILRTHNLDLKVKKSESEKHCTDCGKKFFKNGVFSGCQCLTALAKNISTYILDDGYLLKIKDLDDDAISTICELLKD